MSISQRADSPYWWAASKNPLTGRVERWSTGEKSKAAADRSYRAKLAAWAAEAADNPEGLRPITLSNALREYITSLGSRPTAKTYRVMMSKTVGVSADAGVKLSQGMAERHHIDPELPLHKLQSRDLEVLRRARIAEGNKPATVALEIAVIRAALTYCGDKLSCRVPTKIKYPMPKVSVKTRVLSHEEFLALYDYLDPARPIERIGRSGAPNSYVPRGIRWEQRQDVRDLMVGLVMTGGRWLEIAKLTWSDIMVSEGSQKTILLRSYKTDVTRVVPMTDMVQEMLQRRMKTRKPGEPYIFPGRYGGARAERCSSYAIRNAMTVLGFNRTDVVEKHGRCNVHTLRHTFATWLSQDGADIAALQAVLGHANIRMTQRYVHLDAVKTANRLGAAMNRLVPPCAG